MKNTILSGLLLTFFLCGCVGVGGTQVKEHNTIGQELTDLKKARDANAVSEKEYLELKEKIMNR